MSKRTNQTRYNTYESIPLFLDATDIALVLGIPRSDAYFLLHAADFPAITIGGRVLVRKEKLFRWMEQHPSVESIQRNSSTSSNYKHKTHMITPEHIKKGASYECKS